MIAVLITLFFLIARFTALPIRAACALRPCMPNGDARMRVPTLMIRLFLLLCCSTAVAAPHEMPVVANPGPEFGALLPAQALGIGLTMDVACDGDLLYSIGNRQLCIQSGARTGRLQRISTLDGLGNVRQVAVSRGYAFVTSREDGLFIIDVRQPAQPRIACHYDTLELATGIAVSGNLLAVANRFAGIELIDITHPEKPRFLSAVRVGEAQSVVIHGRWLYAGTWSNRAVVIIDLRDPCAPQIVNTLALDGFGDGLAVHGTLLAAATGHHAASRTTPRPGDAAFGSGHGVSFFDISDPAHPLLLSTLKFPPFYRRGMDMWGVVLTQDHAYVNDTHNGFFLIDIRTIRAPRVLGHHQLRCPQKPHLLADAQLTGHPGRIRTLPNTAEPCALVPAGREGLILWHYNRQTTH